MPTDDPTMFLQWFGTVGCEAHRERSLVGCEVYDDATCGFYRSEGNRTPIILTICVRFNRVCCGLVGVEMAWLQLALDREIL